MLTAIAARSMAMIFEIARTVRASGSREKQCPSARVVLIVAPELVRNNLHNDYRTQYTQRRHMSILTRSLLIAVPLVLLVAWGFVSSVKWHLLVNRWALWGVVFLGFAFIASGWDFFLADDPAAEKRKWIVQVGAILALFLAGLKEVSNWKIESLNLIKSISGSVSFFFDAPGAQAVPKTRAKRVESYDRVIAYRVDDTKFTETGAFEVITIMETDHAANLVGFESNTIFKVTFKFFAIANDSNMGLISADRLAEQFNCLETYYYVPAGTKYRTRVELRVNGEPPVALPNSEYLVAGPMSLWAKLDWAKVEKARP